jgi:hypothetical protein
LVCQAIERVAPSTIFFIGDADTLFNLDFYRSAKFLSDFAQLGKCRRPHNRLGFAYQVAFVCSSIAFRSSSHSSFSRNLFTSARRTRADQGCFLLHLTLTIAAGNCLLVY